MSHHATTTLEINAGKLKKKSRCKHPQTSYHLTVRVLRQIWRVNKISWRIFFSCRPTQKIPGMLNEMAIFFWSHLITVATSWDSWVIHSYRFSHLWLILFPFSFNIKLAFPLIFIWPFFTSQCITNKDDKSTYSIRTSSSEGSLGCSINPVWEQSLIWHTGMII